jgi:hypothetical protein
MNNAANPGPVVVGIIDDGIAFANQRFRTVVGGNLASRVEYWWLQDGVYQGQPLPFGRELNRAAINQLLVDCMHAGVVDEGELYRRAGLTDFTRGGHKSAAWREAHGTHVMDLACGYDQNDANPERSKRPIVCVQLPVRVTANTSGAHLLPYVHLALNYILWRASQIQPPAGAGPLPVVVNLSYGIFAGPHDGTSPIERMIERLIALSAAHGVELRVVLPAGNSYLERTHAQVSCALLKKNNQVTLNWRAPPDCSRPSFLEIWLPWRSSGPRGPARLRVTVASPTGEIHTMSEGGGSSDWGPAGKIYGQIRFHYRPPPTDRGMFRLAIRATADLDPKRPLAPAGIWKVTLEDIALATNDVVDLWIQRDDSLYGYPIRGRQSYFDNRSYRRFDHEGRDEQKDDPHCPVRRASTINAIATGASPIVMGGFLRKEKQPAEYSSAGPISPARGVAAANSDGVTAMMASEDSQVHGGVLGSGSMSGSVLAMDGTSVAAPRTARWVAGELAAGRPGDRAAVQGLATASTTIPSTRDGAGLDILPPVIPVKRYDD